MAPCIPNLGVGAGQSCVSCLYLLLYLSAHWTRPGWDPRTGLYAVKRNISDPAGKYFCRPGRGVVTVPTELFPLYYYVVKRKISVHEAGIRLRTAVRLLANACFLWGLCFFWVERHDVMAGHGNGIISYWARAALLWTRFAWGIIVQEPSHPHLSVTYAWTPKQASLQSFCVVCASLLAGQDFNVRTHTFGVCTARKFRILFGMAWRQFGPTHSELECVLWSDPNPAWPEIEYCSWLSRPWRFLAAATTKILERIK